MITVIVGNQTPQSNRNKGHLRLLNSIRISLKSSAYSAKGPVQYDEQLFHKGTTQMERTI